MSCNPDQRQKSTVRLAYAQMATLEVRGGWWRAVLAEATMTKFTGIPALSGDLTTTATQSPGGGGWGDGFLNTTLFNGASGVNKGHNGATTLSFRQQGFWQDVLSLVQETQQQGQQQRSQPYVTIQFGHNDQKLKNLTLAHFQSNLEHFARDVQHAGGVPILVTPLSRRNYIKDGDGREVVKQDLAQQRAATIRAAQASGTA
ncbi:hypothetical protein KEM56_007151 [Ascosphaera pollenicola]|nr:hypothetical protein KEM56_007151 [Ascosphaera pollenicola]